MPHDTESVSPPMSERRAELLRATLAYVAEHSLSDLSLRPLAAAIGSSPRVLLYLFGSKEGLIRELLAANRAEQLDLVRRAVEGAHTPRGALERLWEWLVDPVHRNVMRLFFEGYVRAFDDSGAPGPWHGVARASLEEWLPLMERVLEPCRAQGREVPATLVLATLRGLLLDLLADDDVERVDAAWRAFLDRCLPQEG
ncbi:TetR/AcrR family transcriptional regulator [Allostreptomyces psammosilenae]|uniref:AcrR family transcriptional regulator n=1 Tax=Allostreptomyces psammosilenae TaxID=1892865 RepID=A0A853A4S1_9ACTN|nr:TetR/AcrR family transcriptional regulator [Allostreptomyces psammosilenae]NYI07874.1 AcrR family transcriptional regulator [Allostreptomyces psammosilenae]